MFHCRRSSYEAAVLCWNLSYEMSGVMRNVGTSLYLWKELLLYRPAVCLVPDQLSIVERIKRAPNRFSRIALTSTSCCSWCFTISIGNEWRSGGTRGTTYWITPARHEDADAESAPMPLVMPCLVPLPRHGGGSVAHHEHRAKGRLSKSSEPPYLIPT
ncbi:hypothetical protein CQW23_11187 [Capsicum baccatum]|uniref:Uncharacterized protein n=1 Tax=Capsicum baccatum TaxID=33114 RepID=A0A2G2X1V9_CAPBA|nr:hypothetical protein CQW23_11187 [Capsicum baccatum]